MSQAASHRHPSPARSRAKPAPSRPKPARRTPWWPFAAVAAVIVLAGVIAIVASRGGDEPSGGAAAATETAPVQVEGTALPTPPPDAIGLIPPASDPAVGQVAPTLHGVSFDGSPVTIGGTGRPTIVLFVAHWCPHCQAEIPRLKQWRADGSLPAAVDWATVSTSVSANSANYPPSAWLARAGWTAPVLADSADFAAAQAYGLQSFPYFVVVKADGTVAARAIGELSVDQVRTLLAAAG